MEIRKFRRAYDLELIPSSNSQIILGDLVWDPLVGPPDFNHPGVGKNLFNAFKSAKYINIDELEEYTRNLSESPFVEAAMAARMVDVDVDMISSLTHPQLAKLDSDFSLKEFKKFTFKDVKAKVMPNSVRVDIEFYLNRFKAGKWTEYDSRIRRLFIISELFFGDLNIVIEKELAHDFEATVSSIDLEISNKLESNRLVEYTFAHQTVPFAMRIERVRDFKA